MTVDQLPHVEGASRPGPTLQYEVEQFYYLEADLLDERRYREWFELFTPDVHYWMPVRSNTSARDVDRELSAPGEMAYFDEDHRSLEWRIKRLETGMAWTEDPPSRTRHLVSNVRLVVEDAGITARSNFVVYRNRLERQVDLWVGTRTDRLLRADSRLWVDKRLIVLDQNVVLSSNLAVFF